MTIFVAENVMVKIILKNFQLLSVSMPWCAWVSTLVDPSLWPQTWYCTRYDFPGILLLEELVETFEDKALQAIVDAVQKRIVEAAQAKAAGRKNWWKAS